MDSFGVRFNETNYIKVDIDFSSGDNTVTLITEVEGTPMQVNGAITWDEPDDGNGGLG